MERPKFEQVFIEGKAQNLPKEENMYFAYHKNGRKSVESFYDTEIEGGWWLANIESWLRPIAETKGEEENPIHHTTTTQLGYSWC